MREQKSRSARSTRRREELLLRSAGHERDALALMLPLFAEEALSRGLKQIISFDLRRIADSDVEDKFEERSHWALETPSRSRSATRLPWRHRTNVAFELARLPSTLACGPSCYLNCPQIITLTRAPILLCQQLKLRRPLSRVSRNRCREHPSANNVS